MFLFSAGCDVILVGREFGLNRTVSKDDAYFEADSSASLDISL